MDENTRYELDEIKQELKKIIDELNQISAGVRYGFSGIGSDRCANSIDDVVRDYRRARTKLNQIK